MTVDSDRKKLSTSDREFRCNDANPNVFSLINVTEQPPTRQLPVPTKSGLLQNKGSWPDEQVTVKYTHKHTL